MKDYYSVKAVSNSSLSWFLESPKTFKMQMDGEIENEKKDYFDKGQQIHMYILEPEEFEKEYAFLDYDTPKSAQQKLFCEKCAYLKNGTKNEQLIKAYRSAYTTKEQDDKVLHKAKDLAKRFSEYIKFIKLSKVKKAIVSNSWMEVLDQIKTNTREHKKARELLYNDEHVVFGNSDKLFIQNEFAIYWTYTNGLECKSMLDRFIIDYENKVVRIVDVKTTLSVPDFRESIDKYSYHRQMAFYWLAVYWYFKNELKIPLDETWKKETYIIAVGKKTPNDVKVFEFTDTKLNEGFDMIEPIMEQLKWHYDTNNWDHDIRYYHDVLVERV